MGVRGERGNREGTAKVKMNGKRHARECGVQTERNMREREETGREKRGREQEKEESVTLRPRGGPSLQP